MLMEKHNRKHRQVVLSMLPIYFLVKTFFFEEETSNKRSLSSDSNCEKIEYLIRDELIRSRPTMNKGSGTISTKTHLNLD